MKNLIYSAFAVAILFTACKYEEGPGISLRSKRDRVANEWKVDKYTYTAKGGSATDKTDKYNIKGDTQYTFYNTYTPYQSDAAKDSAANGNPWGDSVGVASTYVVNDYSFVMIFTRTGAYSVDIIGKDDKGIDPRLMAKYTQEGKNGYNVPDPLSISRTGRSGEWSFVSKSSRIQVSNDLAGSNFTADDIKAGKNVPVVYDIVELRNDEMKLKAEDADGGIHEYTLKPFNADKYLK